MIHSSMGYTYIYILSISIMNICIPSFVAWTWTWKIIVGICWDYLSELDGIGSFVLFF